MPLEDVLRGGHIGELRRRLAAGLDPDSTFTAGSLQYSITYTPLSYVCCQVGADRAARDLEMARTLIDAGAGAGRGQYRTPLWLACERRHEPLVRLLLGRGARFEFPRDHAMPAPTDEILQLQLAGGRDLNYRCVGCGSPGCSLLRQNSLRPERIAALLRAGADPNLRSGSDGKALLHAVCGCVDSGSDNAERAAEVARLMLDAGADAEVRDRSGRTPLYYACHVPHTRHHSKAGQLRLVRMLVGAGADPLAADQWGSTPQNNARFDADVLGALKGGPGRLTKPARRQKDARRQKAARGHGPSGSGATSPTQA